MKHIVMAVVMTGLIATPARAQEVVPQTRPEGVVSPELFKVSFGAAPQAAAPAPAPKKVTVLVGADFPSLYMFRGIRQEFDANFTMQPYVDIGIAAAENVTVNFGSWNSFHTGSNKTNLDGSWYETDFYASVTVVKGKWKPGVLYTVYASPAGGYESLDSIGVHEIAASLAYDDSAMAVPMSPKVTLAFELTDTQADFGAKKGVYLEGSVKPSFKAGGSPVTIGVPIKLGMSLKDYYEGPEGDSKFGFFAIGVSAGVPLSGMTAGAWELHGGVDIYTLGKTLKAFNVDERSRVVGSVGFSVTF
jgi:hypothetical protein